MMAKKMQQPDIIWEGKFNIDMDRKLGETLGSKALDMHQD